ncbi:MAG: histidine--tRNA ligase [Candidatus Hodarchaeaceae archaeon]|nr:histidine--tRNA ligase [Candidatus Hodarchaeaceae archaeon]
MQRPRGTRDLFGEELASVRYVTRVMDDVFKRYGYVEVETPMFENLELFTKKTGAGVIKQIYAFQDKSGRWLALRPELTAPVVRFYINQLRSAPKPVKLFYFGSCFRYEEPQARRWRQFLQSGAEIIGSSRPEADAEIIALTDDIAKELGLSSYELRIGHVRLLREILARAGVKGDAQDPIMRAIDGRDDARLKEELDRSGIKGDDRELLKAVIALRGEIEVLNRAEKLLSGLPRAAAAVQNLRDILSHVHSLGVEESCIDLSIARGLEYYTDMVFELYVGDVQIAGGGRYDQLIEILGGEPCPAVGVGLGVDRIAQVLLKQKAKVPRERLDCMVLPASEEMLSDCLKIGDELRKVGLLVDVDLMGRSLSKAIAYADAKEARYVVIVGAKDLSAGKVTLRDMQTGKQELIARNELAGRLKSA